MKSDIENRRKLQAVAVNQGSSNLALEGHCPAEFISNSTHTRLNQLKF